MHDTASPRVDVGLSLFLIIVSADVLWETRKIPPPRYEPLGSAPLPQAVAGLIILLSLAVLARAILRARQRGWSGRSETEFRPRPWAAALLVAWTAIYILALGYEVSSFGVITFVYLFLAVTYLNRFRRAVWAPALAMALIMGFGSEYVFTRVFFIDLPTYWF